MDDLLTTRQVIELLKVDRITIYRMLQDGRLKGIKIGQQWRFPQREIERFLAAEPAQQAAGPVEVSASFPTHCVQTIQELFSEVGQVSALVVDRQGEPLTQVTQACEFCQLMLKSSSGQEACLESWRNFAGAAHAGSKFFTCHAGLQYVAAPIIDNGKPAGLFLAGQFHWEAPEARVEAERLRRLASAHGLEAEKLQLAAARIPVIQPEQHARIETWPESASRAVQSILHERTGFMSRLQQIAHLSQIL
jgi:excisionase family DNA binding protein